MNSDRLSSIDWNDPLPLLPLRDIVIFPGMVAPLFVGREKSVQALDWAFKNDKMIMLAAQKDAKVNDPSKEEIHSAGCVTEIMQILRLPAGTVKALVEGLAKARRKS